MAKRIGERAERREYARKRGRKSAWFGLGMFGLVGWSISVPTILGIALGVWLDDHYATETVSWTITFLLVGVIVGCICSWYWLSQEVDEDE